MRRKLLFIPWLLAALLASCIREQLPEAPAVKDGETDVTVRIRSAPVTYAMDDAAENRIGTIDVLAFRETAPGIEYFAYRSPGTITGDLGQVKEFTVTLKKDGYKYRLVILANAKEALDAMEPIPSTSGKEALLNRFLSQNPSNDAWPYADPGYRPIPMWGETASTTEIVDGIRIPEIGLVRSLARIDVTVAASAQNVFELEAVYLYNAKDRGCIVPNTGSESWDATKNRAKKPTVPLTAASVKGPIPYEGVATPTGLTRTIYTYEAAAVGKNEDLKATCLVVKGKYNGTSYYYRIDFTTDGVRDDGDNGSGSGGDWGWGEPELPGSGGETGEGGNVGGGPPGSGEGGGGAVGTGPQFGPLLRNHIFEMKITAVGGEGFDTPDEAFAYRKANLQAEITAWNMTDMDKVYMSAYSNLKVSQSVMKFSGTAQYDEFYVESTFYDGNQWSVEVRPEDAGWLSVAKRNFETVRVTVGLLGSGKRTGYVYVRENNLTKTIQIVQTAISAN